MISLNSERRGAATICSIIVSLAIASAAIFLAPVASGQDGPGGVQDPGSGGVQDPGSGGVQNPGPGGGGSGGSLTNPLKFNTITEFLVAIIDVLLILAVPIIIFFIIYAGYLFVTAQGNETKLTTARSAFTWAVVGGIIVLGAKIIITVIQSTVAGFQ